MKIFTHPEQHQIELFLTNATKEQFDEIDFFTKRKGKVSYDGNGNALSIDNWYPVFVNKNELAQSRKLLNEIRSELRNKWQPK